MRKAALHNLGCKVNSYETEAMQQLLEAAGYQIVDFEEKIPPDAPPGQGEKSGGPCGGCGLLCPGGWRKAPG